MEYTKVSYNNFIPAIIEQKKLRGKKEKCLCKEFLSFDSETSNNGDNCWIYQWCFSYPSYNPEERLLVYGRYVTDFIDCLLKIIDMNQLDDRHELVIYVHNLSYDFAYFVDWLELKLGEKGNFLAIASHKIISYKIAGLWFKCSYRLSQRSLSNWAKELSTKHKKLSGAVDYSIIRYPTTLLYRNDWRYMFYDVIVLDECIYKQLEIHGDTLDTIPLTNTGYVRRYARKQSQKDRQNYYTFQKNQTTFPVYRMLRSEFSGGYTHGNRFMMNQTVEGIIRHRDFVSHYPSQQIAGQAPCSRFVLFYNYKQVTYKMDLEKLCSIAKSKCVLVKIYIENLLIKQGITAPTAQECKFRNPESNFDELIADNGRILAYKGYSVVVLNEYDLKWLLKQYTFGRYKIIEVYIANKGSFPDYLKETVNHFFFNKSKLKEVEKDMTARGIKKDNIQYIENHRSMMISKGMLNGIYGMSATDIVRDTYIRDETGEWTKMKITEEDIKKAIEKYYKSYNSFMEYALGTYTTALARNQLFELIEVIGYDNFIYADTDSIFYFSAPEIEQRIEDYNKAKRLFGEQNGYYIDTDQKRYYYNQFELEKEEIIKFRFLHAKCYCYITADGEMHSVIAGVNAIGREEELSKIENLKDGFIFRKCGGTIISYINDAPHYKNIAGNSIPIAGGAIIKQTTKELHAGLHIAEESFDWELEETI